MEVAAADPHDPLVMNSRNARHWREGVYDVWWLSGGTTISQGAFAAHGQEAVVWIEHMGKSEFAAQHLIVYLDGNVIVDKLGPPPQPGFTPQVLSRLTDDHWLGEMTALLPVKINAHVTEGEPVTKPPAYQHAMAFRAPHAEQNAESMDVRPAQFAEPVPPGTKVGPSTPGQPPTQVPVGSRRVRAYPRTDMPVQIVWSPSGPTNERIAVISSGVNLIVDGMQGMGSIDVSADRMVVWTVAEGQPDIRGEGHIQSDNTPLEIYMEGNVVFRQGTRIVHGEAMYYDVNQHTGIVLNAEVLTPMANPTVYTGLVRFRAAVLRQVEQDRYVASNADFTTSRMGDPTYDIFARNATYTDKQHPVFDLFGNPVVDPVTGLPRIEHEQRITGYDNVPYVEGIPVGYWPYLTTDLSGGFLLQDLEFKTDAVFGNQLYVKLDAYQLFNIQYPPKGTSWNISLDELGLRGPAAGTNYKWDLDNFFGVPGRNAGSFDAFFIQDHGIDDLGADRLDLVPEARDRGRLLEQSHTQLWDGWQLSTEIGLISDRNFLEEYFQQEWDARKDESTDFELRKNIDNSSFTVTGAIRTDEFFTDTSWLPKLDHYWMGQPLLDDTFTWYEHTSLGYAQQGSASMPTDPLDADKWTLLPWETPGELKGSREASRQELDLPVQLGPVKVVPYFLGEVAHWDEDLEHQDLNRAYGVAGIRASLPMWAVDPTIQSELFNVNGIAHKVVFTIDANSSQATDGNADLFKLPLYDQLDDWSIQHFERRFAFNTFGNPVGDPLPTGMPGFPMQFDPRLYALRRGMDEWVTGPTEIAGDQTVIRLDADERWQTKRGQPGDQHIIDWITLDTEVEVFPIAKENFGSSLGQFDYDFHWYVGDRTTVVSSGIADFFGDPDREFTVGAFLNRTNEGNYYVGYFYLGGPLAQQAISTAITYRLSPKWAATLGTQMNLVPNNDFTGNILLTRIGEAFLMTIGFSADASTGSVGASFLLEPRNFGKPRLSRSGLDVGTAGAQGLE